MLVLFLGPAERGGGRHGERLRGMRACPALLRGRAELSPGHGHGACGLGPNFPWGPWWLGGDPPRPFAQTHCFSWASRSLTSASRLLTRITSSSSKSCSRLFCASVFCQSAREKQNQTGGETPGRSQPRQDPGRGGGDTGPGPAHCRSP